ncbi:hypothetical protein BDV95DRAFT_249324 [Massariosphaeria phaeospora]|uniref:Uncharacterized protein n=1 Tax=Massariosphaeria phaeospora TaxID=100035 RepID=A0A7C8HZ41_9PLEO|nr:hypothetical protein BDV95DRAFT_249324 [Massariosphaeria phaeospora]
MSGPGDRRSASAPALTSNLFAKYHLESPSASRNKVKQVDELGFNIRFKLKELDTRHSELACLNRQWTRLLNWRTKSNLTEHYRELLIMIEELEKEEVQMRELYQTLSIPDLLRMFEDELGGAPIAGDKVNTAVMLLHETFVTSILKYNQGIRTLREAVKQDLEKVQPRQPSSSMSRVVLQTLCVLED